MTDDPVITRIQDLVVNQERRISTLERDLKRVLKEERKREREQRMGITPW